jgi:hypothetical protein
MIEKKSIGMNGDYNMPLPRRCLRCNCKFQPNSSVHKLCYPCMEIAKNVKNWKKNYEKNIF